MNKQNNSQLQVFTVLKAEPCTMCGECCTVGGECLIRDVFGLPEKFDGECELLGELDGNGRRMCTGMLNLPDNEIGKKASEEIKKRVDGKCDNMVLKQMNKIRRTYR